MVSTTLHS